MRAVTVPARLVLHQPTTTPWGTPNLSPFCIKLEAYLRLANIPFEIAPADMRKTPKGKIPYISLDGKIFGDSQLIIEKLEKESNDPLDDWLTDEQRATGHILRRMLDEAYYFVVMWSRWHPDESFAVLTPEFRKVLPGPLKLLLPVIRSGVRKTLKSQGIGRHSADEVFAVGKRDMSALSQLLGDRDYLFGDEPSTYDASAFAFVEATLGFPLATPLSTHTESLENLVRYRKRIRERHWT